MGPEIDGFIRWSEQYDLYCKMRFFGDMIAKENYTAEKSSGSVALRIFTDTAR